MSSFDDLLPHCTVRLVGLSNGEIQSTGTGFYYLFNDSLTVENGSLNPNGSAIIGIVTNKHVIEGVEEVTFYFNTSQDGEPGYEMYPLRVTLNQNSVFPHPELNVDLCVILVPELVETLRRLDRKIHMYPVRENIRISEEHIRNMTAIQDLVMIGYPNGIWDHVNNLPIMRKGINATPLHDNYMGEETFAVDIATYRGSSGSPVFIYNNGTYIENNEIKFGQRLFFVGVLRGVHRSVTQHTDNLATEEMLHIGIAIKASKLDVFDKLIRQHYGM